MSYRTLDVVKATFAPMRADDLRPGLSDWIGRRTLWQCVGEADADSEYAGQAAFRVAPKIEIEGQRAGLPFEAWSFPATWIPECDLVIHGDPDAI